jgi:hypothetical protein
MMGGGGGGREREGEMAHLVVVVGVGLLQKEVVLVSGYEMRGEDGKRCEGAMEKGRKMKEVRTKREGRRTKEDKKKREGFRDYWWWVLNE